MDNHYQDRPISHQILLNELSLVDPSSLNHSIEGLIDNHGSAKPDHHTSQLEYTRVLIDFCWRHAVQYLKVLDVLELQHRAEEREVLSAATKALLLKVDVLAAQAAYTSACGIEQIQSKLVLLQYVLHQGWDDSDRIWPDITVSLMTDVECWVSDEGWLAPNIAIGHNKNIRSQVAANACRRQIRRHLRLTKRLRTRVDNHPGSNDDLSKASWQTIEALRADVGKLCETASMTFEAIVVKARIFRSLSHPDLIAFDARRADLAKSYCDDLWWLLLKEPGRSSGKNRMALSPDSC